MTLSFEPDTPAARLVTYQDPQNLSPKKPLFVRLLPLILLVLALGAVLALDIDQYLSFAALKEHKAVLAQVVADNPMISAVSFLVIYAVCTAASVPGASLLTVAGGFLFGTWLGGSLAVIGATLGAIGIFLAARSAFGDVLREKLPGTAMEKLRDGFAQNAFNYLLSLRLIPLFPFWLINLAPAFLGVGLRTFTVATILGIIPGTFIYASIGGGLGAMIASGNEPDFGIIFQPQILLPLVALGILALAPIVWRKFRQS